MIKYAARIKKAVDVLYSPRYSLLTNTSIMYGIFATGDVIAQTYENNDKALDWKRVLRVGCVGLVHGPLSTFYYRIIDRTFVRGAPGLIVAQKVVFDLFFSPVFAVTFVATVALLEGHSVVEAIKEYRRKFWSFFKIDCCIWPPVQSINFAFVPSKFRVLYIQSAILLYTTCLTYTRHSNLQNEEKLNG